jgi:hypothetical protein
MKTLLVKLDPRQAALLYRAATREADRRDLAGLYSQASTLHAIADGLEDFLSEHPAALEDVS